jgi:hypothetical protein
MAGRGKGIRPPDSGACIDTSDTGIADGAHGRAKFDPAALNDVVTKQPLIDTGTARASLYRIEPGSFRD